VFFFFFFYTCDIFYSDLSVNQKADVRCEWDILNIILQRFLFETFVFAGFPLQN